MTDPMTPTDHLRQALRTLHQARENAATVDAEVMTARLEWEQQQAALLEDQKARRETLRLADTMVRELLLAHYAATGERKPVDGAEVTVSLVPTYDREDALSWARGAGMCLIPESLDEKALAKVAKATSLAFVTMVEEPGVRIASDLAKHLGDTVEAPAEAGAVG